MLAIPREASILPYLILMAGLVLGVLFLLPGHPIRPYARIFFVGGVLCICAEGMTGSLLGVYEAKAGLISDPDRDIMLAGFLISGVLHPLMAVIYARLAPARPLTLAVVASIGLGLLEVVFVRSGHLVYRMWHPAASTVFYFGFLTAIWYVHSHRWAVPIWVHVLGMAFWLVSTTSYLLQGILGLWQYPVVAHGNPVFGSQMASMLYATSIVTPIATLSSGLLSTRWPVLVQLAAGTLALLGAQALSHATGWVLFIRWNLWMSAVLYAAELGAVALYARWILPGEGAV